MNLIGWDYLVGIPIHKFSSYTQLTYPMRFCFSIKLLFFQFSKLHLGSFCFVLFFQSTCSVFCFLFLLSQTELKGHLAGDDLEILSLLTRVPSSVITGLGYQKEVLWWWGAKLLQTLHEWCANTPPTSTFHALSFSTLMNSLSIWLL